VKADATVTLYSGTVSGNSETILLPATALDNYSSGTVVVEGTWVSGSSTPGILINSEWKTNLWNDTTSSNTQTFALSDVKGKTLGMNMYDDGTSYTIKVSLKN
jgi:hypothetical protein